MPCVLQYARLVHLEGEHDTRTLDGTYFLWFCEPRERVVRLW